MIKLLFWKEYLEMLHINSLINLKTQKKKLVHLADWSYMAKLHKSVTGGIDEQGNRQWFMMPLV